MTSCSEAVKVADAMTTDPESDDESVPLELLSHSPHTPNTKRSLCFELSSTIVCSYVMDMTILTACSVIFTHTVILLVAWCNFD